MNLPIADLHCDLLSFLAKIPKADPFDHAQIACAFLWLKAGGVRAQVMAIYTDVHPESMELDWFRNAICRSLLMRRN